MEKRFLKSYEEYYGIKLIIPRWSDIESRYRLVKQNIDSHSQKD